MRITRGPVSWAKRAFIAVVLVGAAVIPGRASSEQPQHCTGLRCTAAGSILWTAALPGLWLAKPGVSGTVPDKAGAYAATGGGLAVVGVGSAVSGFSESTGKRLWRVALTGVPAGSTIVGVRAFRGIIAVGVAPLRLTSAQSTRSRSRQGQSQRGQSQRGQLGAARYEVMLSAATGRQIRIYPAATYGGAVAASDATTVIVGTHAINAYDNATGRLRWSSVIGTSGLAWRVTGGTLYVTDGGASGGAAGQTGLLRIDLRTGATRTVHITPGTFPASLSDAAGNVVLFSSADGVRAYDGNTGRQLWCIMANSQSCRYHAFADVELADNEQGTVYLASGSRLLDVSTLSGTVISSAPMSVAASLYSVTNGVALGLDENGLGEAWGYNLRTRRIAWTSASLPWPHFFVDLAGLGGSTSPGSLIALLATCPDVGAPATANSAPVCRRPELEAVRL